ncbi:GPAT2 acyltransferase, partial [Penelope pileata]|nr:GPAT2 acyltransferase [Penelope pileata]
FNPFQMKTWLPSSGQKLDVFIPFVGKLRPLTGRCCQACTPQSWEGFHPALLSPLGFRNIARVSEEDTRFRGWLVRRLCCVLAVWGWKVPTS